MMSKNGLRMAGVLGCLAFASADAALRREPPVFAPPAVTLKGPGLIRAATGTASPHVFDVHYTGAGGYPDVQHDVRGLAAEPTVEALGGGRYRVTLDTDDRLVEGLGRGTVTVRMCTETPCQNPIPGATARTLVTVQLRWGDGPDWAGYQANAAHDGHVAIAVDPRRIAKAWTWDAGISSHIRGGTQVATSGTLGFLPIRLDTGERLVALDLRTGTPAWTKDFPLAAALNPAATAGDRVYIATTGHEETFLWSFDAIDGTDRSRSTFHVQWSHVLAPTIADGVAYVNGGFYTKGVYAFDADDGLPLWSMFSDNNDETTPAVADGRVYYYDGYRLKVYDAFDGTDQLTIEDPLDPDWAGYSYRAAPMLGSTDHVLAPSGNDHYRDRHLVNYSPSLRSSRWTSVRSYLSVPAVNDGLVYAVSNNPLTVDAIDEASGARVASWMPGMASGSFVGNVALTRNLAFVSTYTRTYAIDRATFQPVWSAPVSGSLSISGTGMLLIVEQLEPYSGNNQRVHAYSLR